MEIGYLTFAESVEYEEALEKALLPPEMRRPFVTYKLVVTDDAVDVKGVEAESGIVLRSPSGGEITIVSGAFPYSISVKADFIHEEFQPEYDLAKYKRVPLA